jgi:putative aldouronate transport system permease protein
MVGKRSLGEIIFDNVNIALLVIGSFLFLYPLWFVVVSSFSDAHAIASGQVSFWPVGFNLTAYRLVFSDDMIWIAYGNTIFYVVVGTIINLVLTGSFSNRMIFIQRGRCISRHCTHLSVPYPLVRLPCDASF